MSSNDSIGIDELDRFADAIPRVNAQDALPVGKTPCPSSGRNSLCSINIAWSPELESGQALDACVEKIEIGAGSIARVRCKPHVSATTPADIASSPSDFFCVCYVLAGEVTVEQSGRSSKASPGDLVVFDGAYPVRLTTLRQALPHELITLIIPKEHYGAIQEADACFGNILLTRGNSTSPIFDCLGLIAEHSLGSPASPREKLAALYHACVSLLPLAAGCYDDRDEDETIAGHGHYLLPKILKYLSRNVSDPDLCPRRVAQHFGISVRYLHRILAGSGSTFRSYVVAKRLQHIRDEMVAVPARMQGIAVLARKWGFEDISTFNKAFRKHFGCAPSRLRQDAMR